MFRRRLNKRKEKRLAFSVLLVCCLPFCEKDKAGQGPLPEPELDRDAEITELFLTVLVNKKPAVARQVVRAGSLIEVGRDSFCKLLVKTPDTAITFILHANTRLQIVPRGSDKKLETLLSGRVDIEVKNKGPFKTVHINTPLAGATVKGTRLRVDSRRGRTAVLVYEGKVSVRPRIAELENLPAAARQGCDTCRIVTETLKAETVEVVAGKITTVDTSARIALVKSSPALGAVLRDPRLRDYADRSDITAEEAALLSKRIDDRMKTDSPAGRARLERQLSATAVRTPRTRNMTRTESKLWGQKQPEQETTKIKRPEPARRTAEKPAAKPAVKPVARPEAQPTPAPAPVPEKEKEAAKAETQPARAPAAETTKADRPAAPPRSGGSALLDRLRRANPGKPIFMFRLNDGSSVIGAIVGESGDAYRVSTTTGIRMIPRDEVEGKSEL